MRVFFEKIACLLASMIVKMALIMMIVKVVRRTAACLFALPSIIIRYVRLHQPCNFF